MDLDGPATLVNSTVSDNTFDDQGAIAMDAGELTLVYSTIVSNTLEDDVSCPGLTAGGTAFNRCSTLLTPWRRRTSAWRPKGCDRSGP